MPCTQNIEYIQKLFFWELILSFHHVGHQLGTPSLVLGTSTHRAIVPTPWKSFDLLVPFSKDTSAPVMITFSPLGLIPWVVGLGLSVLGEDPSLTLEIHGVVHCLPSVRQARLASSPGSVLFLTPLSKPPIYVAKELWSRCRKTDPFPFNHTRSHKLCLPVPLYPVVWLKDVGKCTSVSSALNRCQFRGCLA